MANLFNMNNPVWVFMGKLVDMAILTVLWAVCSLPVITIGASTTALYDVTLKLSENKEGYIISSFFHAFKRHFKQSTGIGLAAVFIGIFLLSDLYVYYHMESKIGVVLFTSFFILTILYVITVIYLFPLRSHYDDMSSKKLLAIAFMTALKNPGWTLLMVVSTASILAVGIFVMAPILIFSIGLIAYIHAKIINYADLVTQYS